MNTSINISRVITKIQNIGGSSMVTNHQFNELNSLVNGLNTFVFTGLTNEKKFTKYHLQIMNAGFMVGQVINNEPMFDNAIDFKIVYVKCN